MRIVVLGVVVVGLGLAVGWLLRRRRHEPESFVTLRWRADHRYSKSGDDRWK